MGDNDILDEMARLCDMANRLAKREEDMLWVLRELRENNPLASVLSVYAEELKLLAQNIRESANAVYVQIKEEDGSQCQA